MGDSAATAAAAGLVADVDGCGVVDGIRFFRMTNLVVNYKSL